MGGEIEKSWMGRVHEVFFFEVQLFGVVRAPPPMYNKI